EDGFFGLYRGLAPSVVRTFPATACLFVVYEYLDQYLSQMADQLYLPPSASDKAEGKPPPTAAASADAAHAITATTTIATATTTTTTASTGDSRSYGQQLHAWLSAQLQRLKYAAQAQQQHEPDELKQQQEQRQ